MCGSYQKYIKTIVTELLHCPVWSHFFYVTHTIEGQVTWPIRIKIFKSCYYKPSMETKFSRISSPVHLCL